MPVNVNFARHRLVSRMWPGSAALRSCDWAVGWQRVCVSGIAVWVSRWGRDAGLVLMSWGDQTDAVVWLAGWLLLSWLSLFLAGCRDRTRTSAHCDQRHLLLRLVHRGCIDAVEMMHVLPHLGLPVVRTAAHRDTPSTIPAGAASGAVGAQHLSGPAAHRAEVVRVVCVRHGPPGAGFHTATPPPTPDRGRPAAGAGRGLARLPVGHAALWGSYQLGGRNSPAGRGCPLGGTRPVGAEPMD
jgi:hypothetical protein